MSLLSLPCYNNVTTNLSLSISVLIQNNAERYQVNKCLVTVLHFIMPVETIYQIPITNITPNYTIDNECKHTLPINS